MKTPLALILSFWVLVAVAGLSVAQERKAGPQTAIPEPNKVVLSATPKVASTKGCPVTAWVGFNQQPTPTFQVDFAPPLTGGRADAKGEVKTTVPWNTTVRAEVKVTYQALPLKSNNFVCGDNPTKGAQ